MLSPQAWNAFLKTLEEPPPNTIFVLATTEAQQGPADGRRPLPPLRLPAPDGRADRRRAAARRRRRRGSEVARRGARADRAPRDRLVPRRARHARAARHLRRRGSGWRDRRRGRARGARRRRRRAALRRGRRGRRARRARRAARASRDSPSRAATPASFVRDLEAHARELLVVQMLGEVPGGAAADPERDARLAAQAAQLGRRTSCGCSTCSRTRSRRLANGADARIQLELALVKAAAPEVDPSTARAAGRGSSRLEAQLGGGRAGSPLAPRRAARVARSRRGAAGAARPRRPAAPERSAPTVDGARAVAVAGGRSTAVRAENAMLAAALADARPVAVDGRRS